MRIGDSGKKVDTASGHPSVLLTGATGYVGGRLLAILEGRGQSVRCLTRTPEYLQPRVGPRTEVIQGDVMDGASIARAAQGVEVAYYFVHSMGTSGDFERQDREAAHNFGQACKEAGVRCIVYLGGLGRGTDLSPHLRSRHETGEVLRASGVPVIEFRASIVIGSGSLSFEMVRSLVRKLPVMITPRWVRSLAQPIAIEDLLDYLVAAQHLPMDGSQIFEIGGADQVSYVQIMQEYARQRGLRRLMIPVPVLSPTLSSRWLGLVTPLYARVGRKLLDSVRNDTVVEDDRALAAFPIRPRGIRDAVARALVLEDRDIAETRWSDALSSKGAVKSWGGVNFQSRVVDSRAARVPVAPSAAFAPIRRIGGSNGWYFGTWLWRLRGFLDLLVGGVGTRRGRRDPETVMPGDALDFWRVEAYVPNRCLRLAAEMKVPGRAWLQFDVEPDGEGSVIRQTAVFDPVGVFGLVYWYGLYPLHRLVFGGMLAGIVRRASSDVSESVPAEPDTTDRTKMLMV